LTRLISSILETHPDDDIEFIIDRQGGRIDYAALLYRHLKAVGLIIDLQSPEMSVYRIRFKNRKLLVRVIFTKKADSKAFSVSLASMISKYVRELHMLIFNCYWKEFKKDLQPTAGYPVDAFRFLEDTTELRQRLGIREELLVRCK
jgi:ribonuclease HII